MSRVATWTLGPSPDARAAGELIASMRLDLLLLADLPSARGGLRRLVSASGMQLASRAGRGRSGSAVLVGEGVRVLSSSGVALGAGRRRHESAHAIVGLGGHTVQALAFRLSVDPEARLEEAVALAEFVAGVDRPALLGGDLGEGAGGPAAAALLPGRIDVWAAVGQGPGATYPCHEPTARHDVLLVDDGVVPRSAQVPGPDLVRHAAGHLPVLVELQDTP
jgi:endonuclease/exonuclease/phosphatase family metal-dependent hydrolase